MKVLFLTNVPSPYRVDFFNELGKECDLTVLFEKNNSDERDPNWAKRNFVNFKGIFLNGLSVYTDLAFSAKVIKYIKEFKHDIIVCGNFISPTVLYAIAYMRIKKIPFYLETDGGLPKKDSGIKEKVKRFAVSQASGCFSSGKCADSYYLAYGAKDDQIFRYPFTSIYERDILEQLKSKEQKEEIRGKIGIVEDKVIISVGRFSYQNGYGKGYDTLMRVAEMLSEDIGIYIIGDDPTEEFIQWKREKKLSAVHFIGFKDKAQLSAYYQAADLSILLTRGDVWGLVVNESMANGCPVITTGACVAGLELIQDGYNGYLVPVDDKAAAKEKIERILNDDEHQKELSEKCLSTIQNYTIEKMCEKHKKAFEIISRRCV